MEYENPELVISDFDAVQEEKKANDFIMRSKRFSKYAWRIMLVIECIVFVITLCTDTNVSIPLLITLMLADVLLSRYEETHKDYQMPEKTQYALYFYHHKLIAVDVFDSGRVQVVIQGDNGEQDVKPFTYCQVEEKDHIERAIINLDCNTIFIPTRK